MRSDRPETAGGGVRGAAYRVAEKVANTKPVVKATKVVAKQAAKRDIKNTKKAVNAVADMQAKTKAEKIAKNSVKVVPKGPNATENDAALRRAMTNQRMKEIKSGEYARVTGKAVDISKPKTTIKINSAPKKKGK